MILQRQGLRNSSVTIYNLHRNRNNYGFQHSKTHNNLVILSSRSIFQKLNIGDKSLKDKPWREAASLIIVAPLNEAPPYCLGYLMIERSKGSSVMPSGTVFPGGAVSSVDSSSKWIDLYQKALPEINLSSLNFLSANAHIPPIYRKKKEDKESPVAENSALFSKQVLLRLSAIRETFEEVGILLCKRTNSNGSRIGLDKDFSTGLPTQIEFKELGDRKEVTAWQKRIRKNPEEFITLCEQLKCYPDLWSLAEWGNWLTPTIFKAKARFDTMFYMTIFPKMPRVVFDKYEVAGAQWAQPSSLLEEHLNGKIKLMPPQLYEMSRLVNLKTIPELQDKINIRQELGIDRYFPVIRAAKDGLVFLLPGDDLYPKTPDFDILTDPSDNTFDSTIDELNNGSTNYHRASLNKKGLYQPNINVTRYGHVY